MKEIKTKSTVKDIKVLDKSSDISRRMKNSYIRTKEQIEPTTHDKSTNYVNDAGENIGDGVETVVRHTGQAAKDLSKNAVNKIGEFRKPDADAVDSDQQSKEYTQNSVKNEAKKTVQQDRGHTETNSPYKQDSNLFKDKDAIRQKPLQTLRNQPAEQKPTQFFNAATKESAKRRYTLPRSNELAKRRFIQSRTRQQLTKSNITHAANTKTVQANIQKPSQNISSQVLQYPAFQSNQKPAPQSIQNVKKTGNTIKQSVRTVEKSLKTAAKKTGKGTIKTSRRTVKTFSHSAGATIKTSQAVAKAAAVKTAQTTQKTLQAARATARAAAVSVKTAIRVMIAAIKAVIIATKSLIALIAAGGSVAFVVILVICISGLMLGSAFGVFYSNEKANENTPVMKEAVSQLNNEFAGRIQKIQNDNSHDTLKISGNSTISNWQEILAVYAVRTTSDPSNGMEVATLDDEKVYILRNVFWDMNKIDYWLETVEHEETVTSTDENGNETTETITTTETILHINITSMPYTDMIVKYGFNPEQVKMLLELMKDEYRTLFMQLIGN